MRTLWPPCRIELNGIISNNMTSFSNSNGVVKSVSQTDDMLDFADNKTSDGSFFSLQELLNDTI